MPQKQRLGYGTIKAPLTSGQTVAQPNIAASPTQTFLTDLRTNPTQQLGPTGIKFPFRFSPSGRVAVSTTNVTDISHIKESIEQIIFTRLRERFFLPSFGSPFAEMLFEPLGEISSIIQTELVETLARWEPRVRVEFFEVETDENTNSIYIRMSYVVLVITPNASVYQEIAT